MQQYYVDEFQRTYALEINELFRAGVTGVTLTVIDAATYQRLRQIQAAALAQAVAQAQVQAAAQRQALAEQKAQVAHKLVGLGLSAAEVELLLGRR
jgi:hypothetical protein